VKDNSAGRLLAIITDIAIIHQLTSAAATRALAPALGLSEYGLLNHMVRRGDGETPTRLARAFQVSKPSMTATIARLSAKGCVRTVADADDGRSRRVLLTDAGRAAHAEGRQRLALLLPEMLEGYDPASLLAQADMLAALREHLDHQRNARDGLA
jgi:DNA-binding MarR family transcriptional regulator